MKTALLLCSIFLLSIFGSYGQGCTTLGQNPATAFPVCGTRVFTQNTVPICLNPTLPVPGCDASVNYGKNPFWYRFTCFTTGTLGFVINPADVNEDYDWQLYDITGRNPDDVYTDQSLVVTGNWSGTGGQTGTAAGGVNFVQCPSFPPDNKPRFAAMPILVQGRDYLLLVSHFDDTQSGYGLIFDGGTAVITDPKLPRFLSGNISCDAKKITILLNKDLRCRSLVSDGSDFSINSSTVNIINAVGNACSNGFNMKEIVLTLDNPLPAGNYLVSAKRGTDANSLLDNCDREVPVGDSVSFTVLPLAPTPIDSITKLGCAPTFLELVFKKNIQCSSVAADGSDFLITGPVPVQISGATAACTSGVTKKIRVLFSQPLQVGGRYTLTLKNGIDGNPIIDECGQITPVNSMLLFDVKDTVNADFTVSVLYGCAENVVQYSHPGNNGVNSWTWQFDSLQRSTTQNNIIRYNNYREKITTLIVSNGVCNDSSRQSIFFDNLVEAAFDVTNMVCPQNPAIITNNTVGRITSWNWSFGNGVTSNVKDPPPQNYNPLATSDYIVFPRLIVQNDYGCFDTLSKPVKVIFSCFVTVPNAFTPNNDGLNDFLYPLGAYKAGSLKFSVYNRLGQQVFYSESIAKRWDGRFKGQAADSGTYVWVLSFTNETGKPVFSKGTTVLLR